MFNTAHKEFIISLLKNEVEFVLIGGYAAILHGVNRSTSDVDIFINDTANNGRKMLDVFKDMGFSAEHITPKEFENEIYLSIGEEPNAVDILNKTPGVVFSEVYENSKEILIGGLIIRVIDIRDLIKNKESLKRTKEKGLVDQQDILVLKRILKEYNE